MKHIGVSEVPYKTVTLRSTGRRQFVCRDQNWIGPAMTNSRFDADSISYHRESGDDDKITRFRANTGNVRAWTRGVYHGACSYIFMAFLTRAANRVVFLTVPISRVRRVKREKKKKKWKIPFGSSPFLRAPHWTRMLAWHNTLWHYRSIYL